MSDSTNTTGAPQPAATATPAAPAPSFVQRRAAQKSAPSKPGPWQTGKTAESKHAAAHAAAEQARQHGDQPQPTAPGSQPATGEKFKFGRYEVSEAELGELISAKAQRDSQLATRLARSTARPRCTRQSLRFAASIRLYERQLGQARADLAHVIAAIKIFEVSGDPADVTRRITLAIAIVAVLIAPAFARRVKSAALHSSEGRD